jgi:type II secretory ATPase GspE/PulE/Tfp pilus assembly ATPase PilB-like protein
MRISTLPTAFGEKMVMRIFDPDNTVKDLDALGFPATTGSAGRLWSSARTASFW